LVIQLSLFEGRIEPFLGDVEDFIFTSKLSKT